MPDLSALEIRLHGEPIGTLAHVGDERTVLAFAEGYIDDVDRPTLGLRFRDRFGELITEFRPHRMKLMPFFSNLLPEGRLRRHLAGRAGIGSEREFFLLRALGRDLPGAVTVEPADGGGRPVPDGLDGPHENALRFSLAGVQLKFSVVTDAAGGLTVPADGTGGDRIVKLPSRGQPGVPENEFSMMMLARMVGIHVPAIDLVDVDAIGNLPTGIDNVGDKAFVIERFDRRDDGSRVHVEDLAQVFDVHAEDKYGTAGFRNIASVIAGECGREDVAEFVRRLTFNTLIGNGDMHLKNWSLVYHDGRNARLSPAYDFVSTIPYIPNDRAALKFSRTGEFTSYTEDELLHLAAGAALPRGLVLDASRETVALFMERWTAEKNHLPMDSRVTDAIDAHLAALPIVGGSGP